MLSVGTKRLHVHQETAIKWMIEREEDGGGLLCDEMGLGKTLTTVGLLLNKPVAATLILGPLAVLDQWAAVIKTTALALYLVIGGRWKHVCGKPIRGRVYITNYDKLISSPSLFDQPWARLICDEAHIMRNYKSKKYEVFKSLSVKRKWFLSGTPIVNRIQDLAALIHMFNKTDPVAATIDRGIEWMGRYALQRTVEQIREALPNVLPVDPIVHHHRLDFASEEEAVFYRGIQGHIAAALENIMAQDRMDMIMFLGMIIRLRQLSTHPQVYIQSRRRQLGRTYLRQDWIGGSTKTNAIMNIIHEEKGTHGFVIFCHFNDEIEVLKNILEKNGNVSSVFVYDGSLSPAQRTKVLEDAEKSVKKSRDSLDCQHTVLLAQIQTAGTGLNLQFMDRVIFTSPWWTAALMDQAVGRVVRLGQQEQVHIHHISLKEEEEMSINIDDYINERVETKRELCTQMLAAAKHDV